MLSTQSGNPVIVTFMDPQPITIMMVRAEDQMEDILFIGGYTLPPVALKRVE